MKKIICLLLVAVCCLIANPLVPGLDITELKFDSQNRWQLEIRRFHFVNSQVIDSLIITTNSGSSKIKNSAYSTDSLYFVIENSTACLTKPLEINASGDFIQLTSYYLGQGDQPQTTTLGFGGNSVFGDFQSNQSIALIEDANNFFYGYALDNTPNLGSKNGADGAVGELSGFLFDQSGNKLLNTEFEIDNHLLTTDNTGHYTLDLLAKKHSVHYLIMRSPYFAIMEYSPDLELSIKPDSTKVFNFDFSANAISDKTPVTKSSALLYNYPNPFNNQTAIYYEVPEGVKYKNAAIRISNIKGEAVALLAANQKSGSVYWNADHNAAGMYIYQLLIDGKVVKSGEMVLLK